MPKRARTPAQTLFRQTRPRMRAAVSRAEANQIAKRQALRTSTKKSFKFNDEQTVSSTGLVVEITKITTGVEDFDRVGNGALPLALTVRWRWRCNSLLTTLATRMIILRSKILRDSAPPVGEILDLTPNGVGVVAGTECTSSFLLDRLSQFDIILDISETVNNDEQNAGNQAGHSQVRKINLGTHPMTFVDGGTNGANKFYALFLTSDEAVSTCEFTSDLSFIDK